MDVVGRSPQIAYHFDRDGVHPTPYLRVLISVELLRRMGFRAEAERYARAWTTIYPPPPSGTSRRRSCVTAPRAIALVVDALCYQPFAELGNKTLADVYRFGQKEQRMIEECASASPPGRSRHRAGAVPDRRGAVRARQPASGSGRDPRALLPRAGEEMR